MNTKQSKMIDDFKNEVIAKFPELKNKIRIEEYEKNAYVCSIWKLDRAYGKSLWLDCDIYLKSINVGHEFKDEVYLKFTHTNWLDVLKESLDIFEDLHMDSKTSETDGWETIIIDSFWDTRYNSSKNILEIMFPRCVCYYYYDFTPQCLEELKNCEAPLIHFNKNIRGKYRYEKLPNIYSTKTQ